MGDTVESRSLRIGITVRIFLAFCGKEYFTCRVSEVERSLDRKVGTLVADLLLGAHLGRVLRNIGRRGLAFIAISIKSKRLEIRLIYRIISSTGVLHILEVVACRSNLIICLGIPFFILLVLIVILHPLCAIVRRNHLIEEAAGRGSIGLILLEVVETLGILTHAVFLTFKRAFTCCF